MSACPDIDVILDGPASTELEGHLATCDECAGLRALADIHAEAACARAEPLIAARLAGATRPDEEAALERHLARCAACREAQACAEGGDDVAVALGGAPAPVEAEPAHTPHVRSTSEEHAWGRSRVESFPIARARLGARAQRRGEAMASATQLTNDGGERPDVAPLRAPPARRELRVALGSAAVAALFAALLTFGITRASQPSAPLEGPRSERAAEPAPTWLADPVDGRVRAAEARAQSAEAQARAAEERVRVVEERLSALERRAELAPSASASGPTTPPTPAASTPGCACRAGDPLCACDEPQGGGTLVINCVPLCERIAVDGQNVGPSPATVNVRPGLHLVDAERQQRMQSRTVNVTPGSRMQVVLRFAERPPQDTGL